MALYTLTEMNAILSKADTTLWKIAIKAERERWQSGDNFYEKEINLIYGLKRQVEWSRTNMFSDVDTHKLAAYLLHKVDGYGFNEIIPYYAVTTTAAVATPSTSSFVLFKQMIVGVTAGAPADGATTYTNAALLNRNVMVVLDGVVLGVGLSDRQSYTFNSITGTITFAGPLSQNQIIQIFTYLTGSAGWVQFLQTIVGGGIIANGATTYTNASLIGKNIVVDVDGTMLPVGVAGVLSYTFNSLTGQITFNSGVTTGQLITVYTY